MAQQQVDIGKWVSEGFSLYKNNLALLLPLSFLFFVLSFTIVLSGPLLIGFAMVLLRLVDQRSPAPQLGDLFQGFNVFLPSLLFAIVWTILLLAGTSVLSRLPCLGYIAAPVYSIVLSAFIMFGPFRLAEDCKDFWSASTESMKKVRDNLWPYLAIGLIASVISAVGVLACGVGVIVTLPIGLSILAVVYRDAWPAKTDTSVPTAL